MDIIAILILITVAAIASVLAIKQAKNRKTSANLPKGGTPTDVKSQPKAPLKNPSKRGESVIK